MKGLYEKPTKIAVEFMETLDDVFDLGQLKIKGVNVDINISQIAKYLGCSRDKVCDVFNSKLPSTTRNRPRYLGKHKQTIIDVLNDKNKNLNTWIIYLNIY